MIKTTTVCDFCESERKDVCPFFIEKLSGKQYLMYWDAERVARNGEIPDKPTKHLCVDCYMTMNSAYANGNFEDG